MEQKPHYQLFIDGAWSEGSAGQVMTTNNPATGDGWATFACAAPEDVARAISAARRVLDEPVWRDMTQTQRGKLLYRLAELIEDNAERIGRVETTDSGKLLAKPAMLRTIPAITVDWQIRSRVQFCQSINPTCMFLLGANPSASLWRSYRGMRRCS